MARPPSRRTRSALAEESASLARPKLRSPAGLLSDMNAGVPRVELVTLVRSLLAPECRSRSAAAHRRQAGARRSLYVPVHQTARHVRPAALRSDRRPVHAQFRQGSRRRSPSASDGPGTEAVGEQDHHRTHRLGAVNAPLELPSSCLVPKPHELRWLGEYRMDDLHCRHRPAGRNPGQTWPIPPAPSRASQPIPADLLRVVRCQRLHPQLPPLSPGWA